MAREITYYTDDGQGGVVKTRSRRRAEKRDLSEAPFAQKMIDSYYKLECQQGSRFNPDYGDRSPRATKEAWTRDIGNIL